MTRRRDPLQRGVRRRAGELGDAVEPRLVDARRGERLGEAPRLGDAEVLEAVEDVVLGVGGVERRRAPSARSRRARRASSWSATSFAASPRSTPDSTKRPIVPFTTSSASIICAAARCAAAAGLLSSCARPADSWPSAASRSRFCSMRGDPAHHRRDLAHDALDGRSGARTRAAGSRRPRSARARSGLGPHADAERRRRSGRRSHPSRSAGGGGRRARRRSPSTRSVCTMPENSSSTPDALHALARRSISPAAAENGSVTAAHSASASSSRSSKRSIVRRSAVVVARVMRRPGTGG